MKQTAIYFGLLLSSLTSCSENNNSKQATSNPDSLAGKKTYINSTDGKSYTTEGEFQAYTPDDGIKSVSGPIQPLNIVLLTDQNKIPSIININKLANFIKGIDSVVIKELSDVKEIGQIILQFTLYSEKEPKIDMSYQGGIKTQTLNELSQTIEKFSLDIRTQTDSCIFQSVYGLKGLATATSWGNKKDSCTFDSIK